jgi:Family of unknown function (DUF6459)
MSVLTPEPAPATARPALRSVDDCPSLALLPLPVSQPPYDDEPVDGRHLRPVVPSGVRTPVGPLRSLPALRLVPPLAAPVPSAPRTAPLPAVRPVAHTLVQGLLEVLAGVRPVTQLRRRTSPPLYEDLEARVLALPRATGRRPPTGAVQSLHVQQVTAGVVEVCATVRQGPRAAALALRMEHVDGAWCCTSLAGLPGET